MTDKKNLHMVSFMLVIIGAVNFGIYGLTNQNLLMDIFSGNLNTAGKVFYTLIGISGAYLLFTHFSDCKYCDKKK